jgi:hypothetical protein
MVAPRVQVKGAKELRRAIKQAQSSDLKQALKQANRDAADMVAYEAQTIVPVLSGTLLESIRASGTQTAGIVRAGRASVVYAGVIHFGWPRHNIEPNPFLYEAADARLDEVIARYEEAVDAIARRLESIQGDKL